MPLLCLLCLPATGFAQAAVDMMLAREPECSLQRLGYPIDPAELGEPTGGASLDEISWYPEVGAGLCVVRGRLLPAPGRGVPEALDFELSLPALWNRRSVHWFGGDAAPLLAKGFAVYGAGVALERRKALHDLAQLLIERMFREPPRFRYLLGSGLDGIDVLGIAQHHPGDYHGLAIDGARVRSDAPPSPRVDLSAFRERNGHLMLLVTMEPAQAGRPDPFAPWLKQLGKRQADLVARLYGRPPGSKADALPELLQRLQKWVEESQPPPSIWHGVAD